MPIRERSSGHPGRWIDVGEALLERLGRLLGRLGGLLGRPWGLLGRLEGLLSRLGGLLGRLGGLLGSLGSHLGADLRSNLGPGPPEISVVPWVFVDFENV